ncbi:hypothetical protein [Haladaptatus sp. NG-WS-4]
MNRRRFVALLGLTGVSGCFSRLPLDYSDAPAKPVSLRVRSYFDELRTVSVVVEGTASKRRLDDKFHLWPRRVVTQKNVLEAGTYQVEVEVDNDMWRSAEWGMMGCSENTILIDVGKDGVGITATCRDTNTSATS